MEKTPPTILYKYLPQKHAEAMLRTGSVKVGTLFYYRKQEVAARQDQREGIVTTFSEETTFDRETIPEQLKKDRLVEINGPGRVVLTDYSYHVPNAYVYCMSRVLSKQLQDKFESDACIELTNWREVLQIIIATLFNMGLAEIQGMATDCDYSGKDFTGENPDANPYIAKSPKDSYQAEYRLIVPAINREIAPVIIECPDIIPRIRRVEAL